MLLERGKSSLYKLAVLSDFVVGMRQVNFRIARVYVTNFDE